MIKKFFSSDDSYKKMISKYTTINGMLAIAIKAVDEISKDTGLPISRVNTIRQALAL